jgi:cytochrome c2
VTGHVLSIVLVIAAGLLLTSCVPAGSQTTPLVAAGEPKRGRTLITSYGCIACHEIPDAPLTGKVGPPLKGIGQRSYLAGRLANTPENMMHWIRNPRVVDERTVMPDMNVTEQDARDIAALLYTLR